MSSEKETRSSVLKKTLFSDTYVEICEYKPKSKLPPGSILMGRMMHLLKPKKGGQKTISIQEASNVVASEVRNDWINKNVYPGQKKGVARKIKADYEHFRYLRKQLNCVTKPKSEKFLSEASQFNDSLTRFAYDIRCRDKTYQEQMEADFGVKMNKNDEEFYQDNCFGTYKFTCTNTVPKDWVRKRKRKNERQHAEREKVLKLEEESKEQKLIDRHELNVSLNDEISDEMKEEVLSTSTECKKQNYTRRQLFVENKTVKEGEANSNIQFPKFQTRSSKKVSSESIAFFPKVKVRKSFKTLNESVIRCIVQCQSESTCSTLEVCKIMVNVANMIFQQDWELPENKDKDESEEKDEIETDYSSEEEKNEQGNTQEGEQCQQKKRKCKKDLTFTLPSRRTIMRYLEDASFMNLKYVAEQVLNNEESVVTVGLDDTTKAAGHKNFDIKTDHITIKGKSEPKKTFTTGYIENLSHSGADGATAYNLKLKCLAILADCTVDDLKSHIDFWMSDRGSDLDVLLEKMGVEEDKRLKCCAHVILSVDNAIDKVFKNTEQMIGVQKILKLSAGEEIFRSPGSSIHTLGLIALAKLLSPSHAQHSVSLYNEYKLWLESNQIDISNTFKGFVSNRFGRIAELAKTFLSHQEYIIAFFEAVVDENSNKLVLAVATFVQNEWFSECARIYAKLGELIIFPLIEFLGIDKQGEKNAERNWSSAKTFFEHKLSLLKDMQTVIEEANPNGLEKLEASCLGEVITSVERQINMVPYFKNEENSVDVIKLECAPLTNLGCESEFAKFDYRVKVSGGSTSIQTHSKKNIVATNGLLIDSSFENMSEEGKMQEWSWARRSKETSEVRKLEKDFIQTVKVTKKIALVKKEKLKLEKTRKTMDALEKCKKHGGPITPGCIDLLEHLNNMQLLLEIGYLRLTTCPHIRQMRRLKQNEKYVMQKFTNKELRASIKNAIAPTNEISEDVQSMLNSVL